MKFASSTPSRGKGRLRARAVQAGERGLVALRSSCLTGDGQVGYAVVEFTPAEFETFLAAVASKLVAEPAYREQGGMFVRPRNAEGEPGPWIALRVC